MHCLVRQGLRLKGIAAESLPSVFPNQSPLWSRYLER
jgi:hypothetical protein